MKLKTFKDDERGIEEHRNIINNNNLGLDQFD